MVCLYVCIYVSKQGRHVIVFVSAHKDTTCTHNVPATPLWVGWGGVLPSAAMYRYNYMFVCMYVSKQGRRVIFIVYANKDIVSVICMYVH